MGSWSCAGYYRQSFQVCSPGYSVRGSQKQSVLPGENFLLYHQEGMLAFCSVPVKITTWVLLAHQLMWCAALMTLFLIQCSLQHLFNVPSGSISYCSIRDCVLVYLRYWLTD